MQVPESQSHSYCLPLLSAQINFQCVDPFQVLHLCSELGLPLLQSYTLHHIASSLTSESVSRVLLTSESLLETCEDDMLKVALQRVHLDCIAFIQTHTRTVFLSESFLLLPKDTLITIISDNKVGILCRKSTIILNNIWSFIVMMVAGSVVMHTDSFALVFVFVLWSSM